MRELLLWKPCCPSTLLLLHALQRILRKGVTSIVYSEQTVRAGKGFGVLTPTTTTRRPLRRRVENMAPMPTSQAVNASTLSRAIPT